METKRLITTEKHKFLDRTVTNNKIVIEFKNFIICGGTGFGVETTAYKLIDLVEGEIDRGILPRLVLLNNKTIPYSDAVINGLFNAVNKSIDITEHQFPVRIREMMSDALMIAICSEDTFGLSSPSDWEFVTEEMLNPVIPPITNP